MMTREDFFKAALKAKNYERRDWVVSALAEVVHEDAERFPYCIIYNDNGSVDTILENGDVEQIEGEYKDRPLFLPQDRVELSPGDLPNIKKKVDTSFYEAIFNACIFVYGAGDKIDYFAGTDSIDVKKLEKNLAARIVDDPETEEEEEAVAKSSSITTTEWGRIGEGIGFLRGLCVLVAPTGSEKSFVINPDILKRRDELYAEYADQLDDPAVLAKIQKELVQMDMDDFKGDPAETFFVNPGKQFGVARKKLHIMIGREEGFGNTGEGKGTILHSLTEPKTPEDQVIINNSMRSGSYSRGKETELAGEIVNLINKAFQNASISSKDCGTKNGLKWDVTSKNVDYLVGTYQIKGSSVVELTEEYAASLIGQSVVLRSPLSCQAKQPSLCATCMGAKYGENPNALVSAASSVPSAIMYIFMKAFHGKDLKTKELVLEDVIS